MANQPMGIWGYSPQEIEQAKAAQEQAYIDQNVTGDPGVALSRLGASAGTNIAKGVGGLGGFKDPSIQRAMLMEEAKQEVESSGMSVVNDPMGYYKASADALAKRGLMDEAMMVRQIAMQEEAQMSEIGLNDAKTKAELNKDRYRPVGKGGLYDTRTGKTIAPMSSDETKPQSPLGKLAADLDAGLISQEEYDAAVKKLTTQSPTGTMLERLAAATSEQANAIVRAAEVQAAATTRGKEQTKADVEYLDESAKQYDSTTEVIRQLDNIKAIRAQGDTKFGTWIEARRDLAAAVKTFFPSASGAVEDFINTRPEDVDAVERAGNNIVLELFKGMPGLKTNRQLEKLEKSGPAIWSTNEGLELVDVILRKRAAMERDRTKYLIDMEMAAREGNGRHPSRVDGVAWNMENGNKPQYTLTEQDIASVRSINAKAERINNYKKNAQPVPSDPSLFRKGKTYYSVKKTGGYKFGRWNGTAMEILDEIN